MVHGLSGATDGCCCRIVNSRRLIMWWISAVVARWVIVKDYISTPTDLSHIDDIFKNFRISQEAKMHPRDVRPENYRESKFLDLSRTRTFPHPEWSDFEYVWFYDKTVHSVKNWKFDNESRPHSRGDLSTSFFTKVLAFFICRGRACI
jgi:Kinetochore Sim4 complex subunit FTA2